ncbi:MAG TPA: DNA-binding response regulator [Syntrophomonas sp.]|nr:DNA-binding response regulator [Syntrophomonas sp.]
MKGKILVVDDEEALTRLISYNLQREGFTSIQAYDGTRALEMIEGERPDLIILDVMLPGKDGLEICRDMRAAGDKTPVIMLTARDDEIDKVLGLELGADDYVTKPFSVRELMARVKAVLRRRTSQEEEPGKSKICIGSFTINPDSYEIFHNDYLLGLTVKEYELLDILLRNRGKVLKRDYLLEVLWDYSDSCSTRVLDVHISNLREKIEKDSKNPQYIKTVRGLGYKFEEEVDV